MIKISLYVLYFLVFSILGWIWEVMIGFIKYGKFINYGTLFGPWCPIYGWGGLIIVLISPKLKQYPVIMFFTILILCGLIEYFTSWYLEISHGMKWWDYSNFYFNINGRVCLEGLTVFSLLGCIVVYWLAPIINNFYEKSDKIILEIVIIITLLLHITDFIYSSHFPNTSRATQIEKNIKTLIK